MHTGPIPAVITSEITLELVIGHEFGVPVSADFSYSAHDPFSLTVLFRTLADPVSWTFSRDLLLEGTQRRVGEGDISLWPAEVENQHVVCIALRSPAGQALLEAPAADVDAFLRRTYEAVPAGCESQHLNIDALIMELLAETEQ